MTTGPLSADVLGFLDRVINSVEELEILLLLKQHERPWTAEEVSLELRSSEMSAAKRLGSLVESGVIRTSGDGTFRYVTADVGLDRLVEELSTNYKTFRVRIIERIYSKPDNLKSFAEAFRLRKEG